MEKFFNSVKRRIKLRGKRILKKAKGSASDKDTSLEPQKQVSVTRESCSSINISYLLVASD